MNRKDTVLALAIALNAACGVQAAEPDASAHVLGQHPAVLVQALKRGIDPNTFIVLHPAQLTMTRRHAGAEHPGVVAWREAATPSLNSNTFIVQPPASTTWTLAPEGPLQVAVVR